MNSTAGYSVAVKKPGPETVPSIDYFRLLMLLPILIMAALTVYGLAQEVWAQEAASYGPLVAVTCGAMLLLRLRERLQGRPSGWLALLLAMVSAMLFALGYSMQILLFQVIAVVIGLAAWILGSYGGNTLLRCLLPLLLLLFVAPLPAGLVAALTMPMKILISYLTEELLFVLGYPIARDGVMLQIGQYQLLVADACAGLQTLFSLEALGLLYVNIVSSTSFMRNLLMSVLIVPVSIIANLLRVIALVLITYYWGDAAGQGFLHDFAGIFLFVVALLLIIFVDYLVRKFAVKDKRRVVA